MKKNLLFIDFNGVLSHNNFWSSLSSPSHPLHHRYNEIDDFIFIENKDTAYKWLIGNFTTELIHNLIERDLQIPFDTLYPIFVKDCQEIDVSKKIVKNLFTLKEKYRLILITNHYDCFDRFIIPSNPDLIKTFDNIYNSYNLKMLKSENNGQAFKNIMNKFYVSPENSILIDDGIHNYNAFTKLGGTAYLVSEESEVLTTLQNLL